MIILYTTWDRVHSVRVWSRANASGDGDCWLRVSCSLKNALSGGSSVGRILDSPKYGQCRYSEGYRYVLSTPCCSDSNHAESEKHRLTKGITSRSKAINGRCEYSGASDTSCATFEDCGRDCGISSIRDTQLASSKPKVGSAWAETTSLGKNCTITAP